MASRREVSFVSSSSSSSSGRMTVESSRKTTTMTSSRHGDATTTTTSVTRQYNVRQLDSGQPAVAAPAQMLDCKMERDGQTGQPRVEMIFSVDQQQQQLPPPQSPPAAVTAQESVTRMSAEMSAPESEVMSEAVRYRVTTSGPPDSETETAVQAAEVAAAAPSPHDVDEQETDRRQRGEADAGQSERRLLDVVMSTLSWNNDVRLDPLIIVVVITLLYLLVRHVLSFVDEDNGCLFVLYILVLVVALAPGVIKHDCLHKLKNRLLKSE